jgi:hypothetical protein
VVRKYVIPEICRPGAKKKIGGAAPLSNGVSLKYVIIPKNKVSESQHNIQTQVPLTPPFLERFLIEKPIAQSEFDIMNELKNACVKIPLLQEIKDVLIYTKTIK